LERFREEMGLSDETILACQVFNEILDALDQNALEGLFQKAEWVTKLHLFECNFETYFESCGEISFPRETANNAYCAVTDTLFEELENELVLPRLISDREIDDAMVTSPALSRGRARTDIATSFAGYVDEIDWDSIVIRGKKFKLSENAEWTPEAISEMIREIQAKR